LRVVTEWLSTRDMAAILSKVSGKKVEPLELDEAAFEQTKYAQYPGAEEFYYNMKFFMMVWLPFCFLWHWLILPRMDRILASGIKM